jgi:GMP synthase-like glutamine amidotransferase
MVIVIKHVIQEGPGFIADFLKEKRVSIKTIELEKGQALPQNFSNIKAVISMGGPMNVYEEEKYPFLKEEDTFLGDVIKNNIPFLGICLGAQLLAKSCGAEIKKNTCREIGWFKVKLTQIGISDPLFEGMDEEFEVFQWHEDQFQIPKNGILLATSHFCPHQVLKVGKCAYGFQFHIEVTPQMVESWVEDERDALDKEKGVSTIKIVKETHKKRDYLRTLTEKIIGNFLRLAQIL